MLQLVLGLMNNLLNVWKFTAQMAVQTHEKLVSYLLEILIA